MHSSFKPNVEPIPPGFVTLPVYAEGCVIPGASSKGVLGAYGIRAFRHVATAVRFVIFSAPGPLVSAQIMVGTEPISDAGQPHTLEHIVFLGSANHRDRGYLDNLACRCISDGTNAWTDTELTAYTATTAGLEGFLNLLPCFLDHILRPIINRAAFDSEVYHIREDGKEAGVVFCEMQGRENSEADLTEMALQRMLYENTPLAYASGGICKNIRHLSNEDIAQFHRNQYCGANISVVVGGSDISANDLLSSVKPLLDQISAMPGFHPGQPSWHLPLELKPLPLVTRKVVPFPSTDQSIGTITLAWRGPGSTDKVFGSAVGIMLKYLVGDVWSPLCQEFVEVENQLASEIDFSQETFLGVGSFNLTFEGVDHFGDEDEDEEDEGEEGEGEGEDNDTIDVIDLEEEEKVESYLLSGKLENMAMKMLRDICSSEELPGGLNAIHELIRKEKENIVSSFEQESHSAVPFQLLEELVYGAQSSLVLGEETRGFLSKYDDIKEKDEAFWISLLKHFFVDAPRIELIMVPDEDLAGKLAKEEQKSVEERVSRMGKEALIKLGRENEERIASLKPAKFRPESFPAIPSTMNISRIPYSASRNKNAHYVAQSLAVETDFISCVLIFRMKSLSLAQRMLLPLLCEIIPSCDIRLEDGCYVPYTDNTRALSEATLPVSCDGVDSLNVTLGMNQQCIVINFKSSPESYEEAVNLVLRTFFQAEVTAERVAAVSQTLLANCTSNMRAAERVLNEANDLIPYVETKSSRWAKDLPPFLLFNSVSSFPLLTFLSTEFSNKKGRKRVRQNFINKMHDSMQSLRALSASDVMVQITARDPQSAHDILASTWSKKASQWKTLQSNVVSLKTMPQEELNMNNPPLSLSVVVFAKLSELLPGQATGRILGVGGVETTYLDVRVGCEVSVGHADWAALHVVTDLLCRIEGPLSDAVRVSGLAYGVEISFSAWRGQMCLSIFESSSPAPAWVAICDSLEQFRRRLDGTDEDGSMAFDLDTAKASMLFSLSQSRSSPSRIESAVLGRAISGVPATPAADQALEAEVEKVSIDCLKRVFDTHLKPLYLPDRNRLMVAVCGPTVISDTIKQFGECKWPILLEERAVEDLCPKQVRDFVKSLKK